VQSLQARLVVVAVALFVAGSSYGQTARNTIKGIRVVAGESHLVGLTGGAQVVSIDSTRTTPSLDFPIQLRLDESGTIRAIIPPATPPGEYVVDATVRNLDRSTVSISLPVSVDALTVPMADAANAVPVILLNGFQFVCTNTDSTPAGSTDTFGQLAALLQGDGIPVVFFNNCAYGDITIEQLAGQLKLYLANLHSADGTPVTQVDLVAHSMGGLIARAYLAGLQANGSFSPPAVPKVRKLIELATPNFGSFKALQRYTQASEMIPGSTLLWSLATWNQGQDDFRGIDVLSVVGNGGTHYAPGGLDDGEVSLTSGSLGFFRSPQYTRIVPYCHTTPSAFSSLVMDCTGHPGIAYIDNASHLTGRIVRSFLTGTSDWSSIGSTPNQDPWLSNYGGMFAALRNAAGQFLNDLSQASFGSVALINGGATGSVFYHEFVSGTATLQIQSQSLGSVNCGPITEPVGTFSLWPCKSGPVISSVGPLFAGTLARTVKSGGNITITGHGFGQACATCTVTAYNPASVPLTVSSWTDQAITALLPATYNGFAQIVVQAAAGSDNMNIMAAPAPAVELITKNSASYVTESLAPDVIAYSEAPGVAPSLIVAPGNIWPPTLGGVSLEITDSQGQKRLAPIYFAATNAIGYLIPAGTALGPATAKLTTSAGTTITGTLLVDRVSPGLFTANASGSGVPSGFWIRAASDGKQTQDYLFDPAQPVGNRVPIPVDLGATSDQVFLSLYGTGFRGATQPTAEVGGVTVPVAVGAVTAYQGVDVVNIGPLPRSLAGRGQVEVVTTCDGKIANTVTINLR